MKNLILGKQVIATLAFALLMLLNSNSSANSADFNCTTPYNVVKTFQTSSSAAFSWQGDANSVWYVRKEDGYVGQAVTPSNGTVTFTGMAPGTYTIRANTPCLGGDILSIIFDDLIIC